MLFKRWLYWSPSLFPMCSYFLKFVLTSRFLPAPRPLSRSAADPLAHSCAGLTSLLCSNCSQKCSCLGACPNTTVEYHRDIQLPWDNPDLILAGLSAWRRWLSARGFSMDGGLCSGVSMARVKTSTGWLWNRSDFSWRISNETIRERRGHWVFSGLPSVILQRWLKVD